MSVLVFGSLNMDLVVQSPRLPTAGETILGTRFDTIAGGKGANQAVAVARQQVRTTMIGRVGTDAFGHTLRHGLAVEGIDVDHVVIDAEAHTGVAAIAVATTSENHIVVVPEANGRNDDSDLANLKKCLPGAKLLLMQFEIPLPIVAAAAELADSAGLQVIIDPAPAQTSLPNTLYRHTHILTPNQVEAAQLVGFPVATVEAATEAATVLQQRGVEIVVITLGEQGVLCATRDKTFHTPPFSVTPVDTVAAGDAFNGGLAVALYEERPLAEAIAWASATAALSVMHAGAQPSLPKRSQVEAFLQQQRN
ncbi:MAG: ribokinase [Cyanobacteria bacterium J06626_18]